jgi:hypothetical protein
VKAKGDDDDAGTEIGSPAADDPEKPSVANRDFVSVTLIRSADGTQQHP